MKPFWKSSTVWINLISVLAIILDLVVKNNLIPDADVIAVLAATANILNRFRAPVRISKLTLK